MATNTPNYELVKPSGTELPDIAVINGNMDKLDTAVKNNETNIGLLNAQNLPFTAADFSALVNQLIEYYTGIPQGNRLISGGWSGNYYFGGFISKVSDTAGVIVIIPATSDAGWKITNNGAGWSYQATL